jgi:hypothetical protein
MLLALELEEPLVLPPVLTVVVVVEVLEPPVED